MLEDPWEAPPEEPYLLTADPDTAPDPTEVVIGFEGGLPVSLDGEPLAMTELIATLNRQAGAYGIGRIDMIENRAIGIKSREVYEAPAAMTLIAAHRALEDIVLTKGELNVKRGIEDTWARTVYDGLWFSPLREALDAFVAKTQELVTGEVRVQLRPAAAVVNGRRSENALYAETLASYATGETFPHEAAEGFIRLASLEAELAAARRAGGTRLTLWQGRVEGRLAPEVWELVKADDAELLPVRLRGHAASTRGAWRGRAPDGRRARRGRGDASSELDASMIEERRGRALRDRAAARRGRPQDPRRPVAERPGRRRRSGSGPSTRARRRRRGSRHSRAAVLDRAEEGAETVMPGYTHLQRAQPVTLGHHLLAWVEMLDRDRDRFALAAAHAEPSPLGAGALAGTTLPLPRRAQLARRGRRPRLRARLPLRVRRSVRPPLADRRGAGAVGDVGVRVRRGCRSRRRPGRR